jgi:3-oxoacyl-(acyl-carrier-protein) synthase
VAREAPVRICLNNSLGFGGHNACLLLRKVE